MTVSNPQKPQLELLKPTVQRPPDAIVQGWPMRPLHGSTLHPAGTGARVLVVDRDARARVVLGDYLQQHGYQVWRAATAHEARATLAQQPMDLVALDVLLPDGNGPDLIREWRTDAIMATRPIIIISALSTTRCVCGGLANGADDYITKPVALKVVAARFAAVLRRYGWTGET